MSKIERMIFLSQKISEAFSLSALAARCGETYHLINAECSAADEMTFEPKRLTEIVNSLCPQCADATSFVPVLSLSFTKIIDLDMTLKGLEMVEAHLDRLEGSFDNKLRLYSSFIAAPWAELVPLERAFTFRYMGYVDLIRHSKAGSITTISESVTGRDLLWCLSLADPLSRRKANMVKELGKKGYHLPDDSFREEFIESALKDPTRHSSCMPMDFLAQKTEEEKKLICLDEKRYIVSNPIAHWRPEYALLFWLYGSPEWASNMPAAVLAVLDSSPYRPNFKHLPSVLQTVSDVDVLETAQVLFSDGNYSTPAEAYKAALALR